MADSATESAATAPQRPDVFISYSRHDQEFAEGRLFGVLEARGKDVWMDVDDIRGGASDWRAVIWAGIASSRVLIFVLTPDSLQSKTCGEELARAVELNKRIIPVLRRPLDDAAVPEALRRPNWILARDGDDQDVAIEQLVTAVETDEDWLDQHARLTERTAEWLGKQRDRSYLLRGSDLRAAQAWLDERGEHLEQPTADQVAFITAARRASGRRQRLLLGGVTLALGASIALGVVALLQARDAQSRALAARAIDAARRDPEQALRLALDAAGLGDTSLVRRALRETVAAAEWKQILRGADDRSIDDVAFSPNGRLVVAGGESGTATIYDASGGRRVATLRHAGAVQGIRFSPDGRRIVTASDDGTARVWDTSGRALRTLGHGRDGVTSAVFDAGGRRVLTATDRGARVWDLDGRAAPIALRTSGSRHLAVTPLSPDGRRALTPGANGAIRLWTISPRPRDVVLRPARATGSRVTAATFSPDGRRILTGDDSGFVCLWTLRGRRHSGSCDGPRDADGLAITDAQFNADGTLYVTTSNDGSAVVRATADRRHVATLRHRGPVNSAAFSRAGGRILTAGEDREARIWTTAGRLERVLRGHTDLLTIARFSADGERVLTGSADGSARTWSTGADVRSLPGPSLRGADVAFSPDSRLLLAVGRDGRAAVWDLQRGRRTQLAGTMAAAEPLACDRRTGCAPWSADGHFVAGRNAGDEVTIWDVRSGRARSLGLGLAIGASFVPGGRGVAVVGFGAPGIAIVGEDGAGRARVPRDERTEIQSARFTRDGRRVLSVALVGGRVRLTDVERGTAAGPSVEATTGWAADIAPDGARYAVATPQDRLLVGETGGKTTRTSPRQARSIAGVAFDATGTRIVTDSADGSARVWDASSLDAPSAVLRGHSGYLLRAEFSPDGRFVLTTGSDDSARLWDPELEQTVLTLRAGGRGMARFSPDGRLIAIGGPQTVEVRRCELCATQDELVRLARARLPGR